MYLVLPAIYLLTKRRGALFYIALIWIVCAVVGHALYLANPRYDVEPYRGAEYPLPFFVPTFLGGIVAFVLAKKPHLQLPSVLWPVVLLAIISGFQYFEVPQAELFMSLLGFAIPQFAEVQSIAVRSVAHSIAKYSYGISLFHEPLRDLCFWHMHSLGVPAQSAVFVFLLGTASVAAYHLLEKPLIDVGHGLARRLVKSQPAQSTLAEAG